MAWSAIHFARSAGKPMIWCRYADADGPVYGLVEDGVATAVTGNPFGDYEKSERRIPVSELWLLPPVTPSTFFCAGLNYRAHAERAAYGGDPQPERAAIGDPGESARTGRA